MEQARQGHTAGDQDQDKALELRAVGMVLKKMRTQKKLSQEQLAWATGMEQTYVFFLLERGAKEPGVRTLLKLARALGVSSGQFMSEVEAAIEGLKGAGR